MPWNVLLDKKISFTWGPGDTPGSLTVEFLVAVLGHMVSA